MDLVLLQINIGGRCAGRDYKTQNDLAQTSRMLIKNSWQIPLISLVYYQNTYWSSNENTDKAPLGSNGAPGLRTSSERSHLIFTALNSNTFRRSHQYNLAQTIINLCAYTLHLSTDLCVTTLTTKVI